MSEVRQLSLAEMAEDYRAYVERARQYHEHHGEWPPDPLLDEVEGARRRIMAEHGNDWRKVLEWYVELDEKNPDRFVRASRPADEDRSHDR